MKYLPILTLFLFGLSLLPAQAQKRGSFVFQGENTQIQSVKGIEGQKAPPLFVEKWIQLPEGKQTINLDDYKGKVLIIKCFQSWCQRCQAQGLPILKKLVDKFEGDDRVQFLAIQTTFEGFTTNTDEKLEPTAKKHELKIPFGQSTKLAGFHSISMDYNTGGSPWWIVINQEGNVEYNGHDMDFDAAVENLEELFEKNK